MFAAHTRSWVLAGANFEHTFRHPCCAETLRFDNCDVKQGGCSPSSSGRITRPRDRIPRSEDANAAMLTSRERRRTRHEWRDASDKIGRGRRCGCRARLLERGADPNAQSYTSWTALHGAAEAGCVDCICALLDAGARPDARAKSGLTPAEIAHKYERDAAAAALAAAAGVAAVTASQTPLETFPVALPETGGTIIITPCPGKRK